ncbi:MAG: pilus assembly protein [Planctomycetia bacterium]|nr:pilus assembly protein [Planctomycetia bacterium]
MHRAILEACFPLFLWMIGAFAAMWLTLRISGARLSLAKLRRLHGCQEGGVQTLSFVLTLPLFMMIVLFIVQVSQLMIGITVVHYAAFAAARAASVWVPAEMPGEPANEMDPIAINVDKSIYPDWISQVIEFNSIPEGRAWKYNRIWTAAAINCIPIAPSHRYLTPSALQGSSSNIGETIVALYRNLVPKSANDPVISNRLRNKAAYAAEHTYIVIAGTDGSQNSLNGPTYNPISHPQPTDEYSPEYYFPTQWQYKANEVGWQDPMTVQVSFRFPLLTGPGRFLSPGKFMSTKLSPADGTPDRVSSRIQIWDKKDHPRYKESVYYTILTATATFTNEGMKSIIPYPQVQESLK